MVEKKAINYYRSFYDVSKDLNQKQFYDFNMAIYEVMFFDKHIDTVIFKDKILSLLWKSVKHSVKSSVDGYCTKKSTPYNDMFKPLTKPLANKDNEQVQVQEEGEVEALSPSQEIAILVSDYLLHKIKSKAPNFKQPNMQTWARDIELSIRVDGRTKDQLIGCINWIYSRDGIFWVSNILSAKKLRSKFDTMESQMMSKNRSKDLDMSWIKKLEEENAN